MRELNFYKLLATIREQVFSQLDEISLTPTTGTPPTTGTGITPDQLNAALVGMAKKPGMSPAEEKIATDYLAQLGIKPKSMYGRNTAASFGNLISSLVK